MPPEGWAVLGTAVVSLAYRIRKSVKSEDTEREWVTLVCIATAIAGTLLTLADGDEASWTRPVSAAGGFTLCVSLVSPKLQSQIVLCGLILGAVAAFQDKQVASGCMLFAGVSAVY